MFQPDLRMREEDWFSLSDADFAAVIDGSTAAPAGEPWPVLDPFLESPEGAAWEDFERRLVARRKAESAQYVWLLTAKRRAAAASDLPAGLQERAFQVDAALALDVSESAAATLLHHLELVERWFPGSWAAFAAGRSDLKGVQVAARQAEGLDLDAHAAAYDVAVVDAFERVPGSRLKAHLHRVRERLQAATAEERHRAAVERRSVEVDVLPDGMAVLTMTGPAVDLLAVDDALQRAAVVVHGRDGEDRSITSLRFEIARDLLLGGIAATPNPDGSTTTVLSVPVRPVIVPTVCVTIPVLTLIGKDTAPAELDGYGPIDVTTARRLAGDASCWTRVLTDPVTGFRVTLDAKQYRFPDAVRRWLRLRDGTCRWPGCTRPATRSDVDHRHEWQDGGESEIDNLAHLCRKHHLLKSTGAFPSEHDPATERITWTTPNRHEWTSDPAPPSAPAPAALLDQHCPF